MRGPFVQETVAKHDILMKYIFVIACSDLWTIHQRKCKNGKNEVPIVAQLAMKSLLVGTGHYLCKVYNYHNSRDCGYKRSGILFRLDGLDGNGMVLVQSLWKLCDYFVPLCAFVIILCDILKFNLIA
jgi:hypothetical protein